jgi:hypothetical protein
MRTVEARRYVTPLREGGSLPAIVEADDLGTYVLKFRGAGQGAKALIAELVAGEIGRALGLAVPEIVLMDVDPVLGRSEPDSEIRSLIKASAGLNLAIDYLPGSIAYDPAGVAPDPRVAAEVVWFDSLVTNVDRTARNTNLLWWHGKLHLIDHGAALYFQHQGAAGVARSRAPFPQIRDHVLLPFAGDLAAADAALASRLSPELIREIVDLVPESWLSAPPREGYVEFLTQRLAAPREFVEEAARARDKL